MKVLVLSALALASATSGGLQAAPTVFWAGKAGLFASPTAKSVLGVSDVYGIAKSFMGEGAGGSAKFLTREGAQFKADTIALFAADRADAQGVQNMLGSRSAQGSALQTLVRASQSSFVAPATDLTSGSTTMSELMRQNKAGFSVTCQGGQQTVNAIEKRQRDYHDAAEATEVITVRLSGNAEMDQQCIKDVSAHLSRATRGNFVGVLSYDTALAVPVAHTAAAGERVQTHQLHLQQQRSLVSQKLRTMSATSFQPGTGTVVYLNSMLLTGLLVSLVLLTFLLWGLYTMSTIHTPLRFETKEVSVAKIY